MTTCPTPVRVLLFAPSAAGGHWPAGLPEARALSDVRVDVVPELTEVGVVLASATFDVCAIALDTDIEVLTGVVAELERVAPELPLVGLVRDLGLESVEGAVHLGVTLMTRVPADPTGWLDVFALAAGVQRRSRGTCTSVSTGHLLALLGSASSTGLMHLRCDARPQRSERSGVIVLSVGRPVHALTGALEGIDALEDLLTWVDAEATWIPGDVPSRRTIVGRWRPRMLPGGAAPDIHDTLSREYPEVIEKVSRLNALADVLGAYVLHHGAIVAGDCCPEIESVGGERALENLARVYVDMGAQRSVGTEIQANVGDLRLVVDRIGPSVLGYQVGVFVRQAAPVCKSLRRLLRQIDREFERCRVRREKRNRRVQTTSLEAHRRVA